MCSWTPRFSYEVSKTRVPWGVPVPSRVVHAVYGGSRVPAGRVYGWVLGGAIPGHYPPSTLKSPPQAIPAKRAPEAPGGLEWVGIAVRGWAGPSTTLRARSCPPVGPPCTGTLECRLLANKARFEVKPGNLVKTTKCHQKVCKRPALVPILQNGSQKSPLDFYRFPFLVAFSHKELMGLFDANVGL